MEGKTPALKKANALNQDEKTALGDAKISPLAAVFPELPPILDHLSVRVRDLNSFTGVKTADFAREISDAPQVNAIEVGMKFSF